MGKGIKGFWQGFWQLADPKIWIASTVPMMVGITLAYSLEGKFNFYWTFWMVIGIYLIEIGKNAINEVIDYNSGVDRFVKAENRTPFSGGKKTIVEGKLSINEAKIIAASTMFSGALIGLYISLFHETGVFWIGLLGFILAIIYSLPPFMLAYRGLGEVTVGFTFGPLIVMGSYLVQAHNLSYPVILISLPLGFLIANVLWINQYPDYEADKKGQKLNWVVRLGRRQGIKIYMFLFIVSYLSLVLVSFTFHSIFWLLPFISLPLVFQAIRIARKNYNNISKLIAANAKTIQVYQIFGLSLVVAALLEKLF